MRCSLRQEFRRVEFNLGSVAVAEPFTTTRLARIFNDRACDSTFKFESQILFYCEMRQ